MVKVQGDDGEVVHVRPRVLIEWGVGGSWTNAVNENVDWERLLEGELIDQVGELVRCLREEAKVL